MADADPGEGGTVGVASEMTVDEDLTVEVAGVPKSDFLAPRSLKPLPRLFEHCRDFDWER